MVEAQGALALNHHDPKYLDRVVGSHQRAWSRCDPRNARQRQLAKDLSLMARRGRIVVIGKSRNDEINPADAMGKGASIIGMMLLTYKSEEAQRSALE
jgi:hypothetical protein